MRTINEKLDNLLVVLNKIPDTYATKAELNMVVSELNNQTTIKWERIKWRWALVVAIVSAIWVVVSTIIR